MSEQPAGLVAPNLPDAAYFSLPESRLTELTQRLSESNGAGLVIGAPKTIDTRTQTSLPVLLATRYDGRRNWEVKADINTILLVSDLDTGGVQVAKPFLKNKRLSNEAVSSEGPPPTGPDLRAMHTKVQVLDARAFTNPPWRASRLAVTVLIHDWRSNTVVTTLAGDEGPTVFRPGLAAQAAKEPQPWLRQDARVAAQAPQSAVPGAAMSVTATGGPTGGPVAWCRIRIAAGQPGPLHAALLLVKKDASGLSLLPLDLQPAQAGGAVREAVFAVDLQGAFEGELEGDFVIYLVAYDQLAGPAQARL